MSWLRTYLQNFDLHRGQNKKLNIVYSRENETHINNPRRHKPKRSYTKVKGGGGGGGGGSISTFGTVLPIDLILGTHFFVLSIN